MSMILITGTPGSGKTLFAVSKILELQKSHPDRQIFADIEGLKIPNVECSPEDWRDTPDNSIIFYDEAQQHERFRSGTSANKDEIVQKLQVHRHTGHDIYFITQSPRFLNAFVLDLIGEHYHLHRPYGAKLASVYYWRGAQKQPNSEAAKERSENNFNFVYPKEVFELYKSATAHHVKFKIPTKIWATFAMAVFVACMVGWLVFKPETQSFFTGKPVQENKGVQHDLEQNQKAHELSATELKVQKCIEQKQFTEDQCKDLNDPEYSAQRHKALEEKTGNHIDKIVETYKASNPFDYSYDSPPAPTQFRVFSGCMKNSRGHLVAYDQQGAIIHEINADVCNRVMKGDRPFNPYKQPHQPAPYQFASDFKPEEQKPIENPQVKIDTVQFGEPKSKYMDSANRY
jgi:zona occludens toxin